MLNRDDPNQRHPSPVEELIGDYEVECQKCGARRRLQEYTSCGWKVGDMVGSDPANPDYGRCFKCTAHQLRVVKTPVYQPRQPSTGFTKIPQE